MSGSDRMGADEWDGHGSLRPSPGATDTPRGVASDLDHGLANDTAVQMIEAAAGP